ncbi:hypothetical protein IGS60_27585 [Janthinobacterium sp. FW305-128]|nr:hypothetical protein [Janthinobacterium sp. FW305-128]
MKEIMTIEEKKMQKRFELNFPAMLLAVGLICALRTETVSAAEYNALIGNPFLFCSAPRPCKHCQPYRRIYNEICNSQSKAKKEADETMQQSSTPNAAQLRVFKQEGAAALNAAMQRGDTIFSMDENTSDLSFNAFAAGWNAEWAKVRIKG